MKFKFIIISLLAIVMVGSNGCNFKEEKLIYKNPEQLSGIIIKTDYLNKNRVAFITENNLKQIKNKFRGLQSLKLNDEVAIYISLGKRPTGGYQILVQEIRKRGSKLIVFVKATRPQADQFVTQALTYPYDVVKLPVEEISSIREINFITNNKRKVELKISE